MLNNIVWDKYRIAFLYWSCKTSAHQITAMLFSLIYLQPCNNKTSPIAQVKTDFQVVRTFESAFEVSIRTIKSIKT